MAKRPAHQRNAAVAVGYLSTGKIDAPFMGCMLRMLQYDQKHQGYLDIDRGGGIIHLQTSPRVAEARSQVVEHFIKHRDQGGLFHDADWLLWLDSDATFEPNLLERLMSAADARERPVVGALAFGGVSPESMFPTIYRLERDETGKPTLDKVFAYPRNALLKVGATGSHCILIHKSVFKLMYKAYGSLPDGTPNPYPWYCEGHVDSDGHPLGEDIIFCMRVNGIGLPVFVHTGIHTGHVKTIELNEELYDLVHPEHREPAILPYEKRELRLA